MRWWVWRSGAPGSRPPARTSSARSTPSRPPGSPNLADPITVDSSTSSDPDEVARAVHLREQGGTIAQILAKTGTARTNLHRHVPPRPPETLTADGGQGHQRNTAG